MAFNGSGTFARLYSWASDKAAAVKIRADRMDEEMDGFATGLSNAICRDGQSTVTANIPFNNKRITGLGDASADTDALNRQSADARYVRNPDALTAATSIEDTDKFGGYDTGGSVNKSFAWSLIKSELAAEGIVLGAGTKALFYQASAPTGWTIDTTAALNNAALRVVTSGAGTTGGTTGFTTVFTSRTISQANLPNVTLTTTITDPGHVHPIGSYTNEADTAGGGVSGLGTSTFSSTYCQTAFTGITASTSLGGSGTAMDFAVKYVNCSICTKDAF